MTTVQSEQTAHRSPPNGPGAGDLFGRRLGVVVQLVRSVAADEDVPNTLLGVWFLDDPDRLAGIEAIALTDTHV